jgi:hypothetical protein
MPHAASQQSRREGKKKGKRTKRENPCIERGRGRACLPFLRERACPSSGTRKKNINNEA